MLPTPNTQVLSMPGWGIASVVYHPFEATMPLPLAPGEEQDLARVKQGEIRGNENGQIPRIPLRDCKSITKSDPFRVTSH
jgi:hypothetical protein